MYGGARRLFLALRYSKVVDRISRLGVAVAFVVAVCVALDEEMV